MEHEALSGEFAPGHRSGIVVALLVLAGCTNAPRPVEGTSSTARLTHAPFAPDTGSIAVHCETLIDGVSAQPSHDVTVIIRDGHIASLFPGYPALEETERWVVGVPKANVEPFVPRVSLTLPVLSSCHELLFAVAGAEKRAILTRVFDGEDLPANRVAARETVWLVDQAALPEHYSGR